MSGGRSTPREVFEAAIEMPPSERKRFVLHASAGNDALRSEVESLLESLAELDGGLSAAHVDPMVPEREILAPGHTIGNYRIEQLIGQGGSSAVYRAQQTAPLVREVAIKLLDGSDREPSHRFTMEQQTLASIDHPHVATVFDAGTADGRPYFVMEYIQGLPIDEYCENVSIDARVRLLVRVCEAVHACHSKGIVHCDLKPTNVLVAENDSVAHPKVIDFGIAFALHGADPARPAVGSPPFIAPEQISNPQALDIRSDVYALGVMLESLVEPVGMSVRRQRRNELEWIVARATAVEPDDRYSTVVHLGADLARWLEDDVPEAAPVSTSYRAAKTLRRHRTLAGSITVTWLLLIGLVLGLSWAWRESRINEQLETEARLVAEQDARRARESLAMTVEVVTGLDPWITAQTLQGADRLINILADHATDALSDDRDLAARVHGVIGSAQTSLGDYEAAELHLNRAFEYWRGSPPSAARYHAAWAFADVATRSDHLDADEWIDEAREQRAGVLGQASPELGAAMRSLHEILGTGSAAETLVALDDAFAIADAVLDLESDLWLLIADCAVDAAIDFHEAGDMQALDLLEYALAAQRDITGPGHPDVAITLRMIGDQLDRAGQPLQAILRLSEAGAILERTLPEGHAERVRVEARLEEIRNRASEPYKEP